MLRNPAHPQDAAPLGTVAALWRYPVKSLQGEVVEAAPLTARGLLGDRAYVLLDRATGTIATNKHARRWPTLLACSARFVTPPTLGALLPPIVISLSDGSEVHSDDPDVDARLSQALGRAVALVSHLEDPPMREADRSLPDVAADALELRREPLARGAPPGTFFDYGPVHLLSTGTLAFLQARYPAGRFDVRRFRPNLLIATDAAAGCIEHGWLGQTLAVGRQARLHVIDPCPRCVVTTLPQGDLPRDPGILRTVSEHSAAPSVTLAPGVVFPAVAGIYAASVQDGMLQRGDQILLRV